MKLKFWVMILLPALLVAGCVRTVSDRKTAAVPLIKDKVEGRYERTVDQVYAAAVYVMKQNGTLENELKLHEEDAAALALEGRVNKRRIYMRVEPVDPTVTSVVVQARRSGGGSDMDLAFELEKQIALRLTVE